MRVCSDASDVNLSTGASQSGYIVFIEGNQRVSPTVWQSKKLELPSHHLHLKQ